MKTKRLLFLSLSVCIFSHMGFAADVNSLTASETLQAALRDEQNNQSAFDSAYSQVSSTAYLDVANNIVLSQNELIAAIQTTITEEKTNGNTSLVTSLKNILSEVEKASSDFQSTYMFYVASSIDESLDSAAVQALQKTIAIDFSSVEETVSMLQTGLNEQSAAATTYINENPSAFTAVQPYLPEVADGTTATVFYADSVNACYYINAGSYSGASVGNIYTVADANGNYIANLKIIKTDSWYAVGTPINSKGITITNSVPSLLTRRTVPTES